MSLNAIFLLFTSLFLIGNGNENNSCTRNVKKDLIPISANMLSSKNKIMKVKEPVLDPKMNVLSSECPYIIESTYLINNNYVVYQNCYTRKLLYPDKKTFRFPINNERNMFALDKNGIYFQGDLIKIDTTGFEIVCKNNDYQNPEILWKTKDAIYKNAIKISVSDVETFQPIECFNGNYFKDKNYVYYFDKKIENSDGASVQKSCDEFTYDKNNAYYKGKIITYKGEKVIPVNNIFYKTQKFVLTRNDDNFTIHPNIDPNTLRSLSASYAVDKNHAYYETSILPIKIENLQNLKVYEQVNRAYISDGKKVYSRNNDLKNNFDAQTFGMLPNSDFCFDKNGVYQREWIEKKGQVIYIKFPFEYKNAVSENNMFMNSKYIIYENQAYDLWDKKIYKNLTAQQIELAKQNKLKLEIIGQNVVKIDQEFDYLLYKSNNKIYWNGKQMGADALSFAHVGSDFYKDAKNVYLYSRGQGLLMVENMDNQTLELFNGFFGFLKDKNFVYYHNYKIIKSKDIELLAIFSGYRQGCSQDRNPNSNYYLFKNFEGFFLVHISNVVSIRNLGKKLADQKLWYPDLKQKFEY